MSTLQQTLKARAEKQVDETLMRIEKSLAGEAESLRVNTDTLIRALLPRGESNRKVIVKAVKDEMAAALLRSLQQENSDGEETKG